ncbi:PhzF family phenazine biosynthesis protein [Streptomyces rimosus]
MVDCLLAHAFVDDNGEFGNPVLVVIEPDGGGLPQDRRQELADRLGIPAVAFVRSPPARRTSIAIHGSYGLPIRFGGHPVLGTLEVLHHLGHTVEEIVPEAGPVACRRNAEGICRLTAPATWSKPWRHLQMASAAEIDALTGLPDGEDFTQVWAWTDETAGEVRARLWAPRIGKGEDEACGSASMLLTLQHGRPLRVLHGRGSVIHTSPAGDGLVELGGRCAVRTPAEEVTAAVERAYGRG